MADPCEMQLATEHGAVDTHKHSMAHEDMFCQSRKPAPAKRRRPARG